MRISAVTAYRKDTPAITAVRLTRLRGRDDLIEATLDRICLRREPVVIVAPDGRAILILSPVENSLELVKLRVVPKRVVNDTHYECPEFARAWQGRGGDARRGLSSGPSSSLRCAIS